MAIDKISETNPKMELSLASANEKVSAEGFSSSFIEGKNQSSYSFYIEEEKPSLDPNSSCMIYNISKCVRNQEIAQFITLNITQSQVEITKQIIKQAYTDLQESEKEHRKAEKESNTWKDVAHVASGIGGVVSICIGAALIPTGPVGAIAGVAMIISGCASIGAVVCEKTKVSSDLTLAIQIAGGVASIAGGIGAFATSIANMDLLIRIGTGLLSAARYAAGGISDLNQMKGLELEAGQTALEATLEISGDQIKEYGNLWGQIQDNSSVTLDDMMEIFKKEERNLNDIVNKPLQGAV